MSIQTINTILGQFKENTKGVEYVGLYSRDAFVLYQVGQWKDESFIVDFQIKLLELQELAKVGWSQSKQIWLEGKEGGYLIAVFCDDESLLLVKADHESVIGQLKIKLEKTIEQLQLELMTPEMIKITKSQTPAYSETLNNNSIIPDKSGNSTINYRGRSV